MSSVELIPIHLHDPTEILNLVLKNGSVECDSPGRVPEKGSQLTEVNKPTREIS